MASYQEKQTLTVLETGETSSLAEFRAGRPMVLDFWHTKCVRCPAALAKLDAKAASGKHAGVVFAACALSLGENSMEDTKQLLEDDLENLTHLFMSTEEKEVAKAEFGFTAVPFCVVFDAGGSVLYTGDPMAVDFGTVFDAPAPPTPSASETLPPKAAAAADSPDSVTAPLTEANRETPALAALTLDDDF